MKYQSVAHSYSHGQAERVGVLLTNLGTPKQATTKELRNYLREFLSDPRVIEVPRIIWWCILHFIILRIRPSRSAKAYQSVWTDEGSPLALHTASQASLVKAEVEQRYGEHVVVEWAMRYGEPSISSTLNKMFEQGIRRLVVLPLYPQYSASTTASTFDAIAKDFTQRRWLPELRFINTYHTRDDYISALMHCVKRHINEHGQPDKLIFSYHGVPQRYLRNGDPYHCYCQQTTRLVAEKMGLDASQYLTSFQSRFGREPWLQPYTDKTLMQLGKEGIKSVAVICPGFASDCLETIEEIDEENREYFLESGGKEFHYIPALNSEPEHISMISNIVQENIGDWIEDISANPHHELAAERYQAVEHNRAKD